MAQTKSNSKNKRLLDLMDENNVTAKELAQKVGVTPEWLSKVINRHVEGYRIRLRICEVFNVSYEMLWGDAPSVA